MPIGHGVAIYGAEDDVLRDSHTLVRTDNPFPVVDVSLIASVQNTQVIAGNQTRVSVVDDDVGSLLSKILKEQQKTNMYLMLMTDETIDNTDIGV